MCHLLFFKTLFDSLQQIGAEGAFQPLTRAGCTVMLQVAPHMITSADAPQPQSQSERLKRPDSTFYLSDKTENTFPAFIFGYILYTESQLQLDASRRSA